ncbi:Protein of unknown function [Streptococcus thermophilus]|nr:Protein of unknown function [Streptococcus thermophilus]
MVFVSNKPCKLSIIFQ